MTNKLKSWSTTAADNNSAAPNGWPEGMAPSDVNNTARQDRASIREWYEDPSWVDLGHSIVSNTSTALKVSGDQTAHFTAGRAVRINADNTYAGYVSASAYSAPDTSITVTGAASLTTATSIQLGGPTSWASSPNTGTITASGMSSSGIVSATAGVFSGTITCAGLSSSGPVSATTGVFSGTITAAGLSASLTTTLFGVGTIAQSTYAELLTVTDGTTTIPYDDTIPQNTEGTEILTCSITPTSSANTIRLTASVWMSAKDTDTTFLIAGLFVGSTANAIAAGAAEVSNNNFRLHNIIIQCDHAPATTSATTYKLRVGADALAAPDIWVVNGVESGGSGVRKFGGVLTTSLKVEEIRV